MNVYDSIIIGAGPAGLSAAIYLTRFNRSVLVIDSGQGRSTFEQVNYNYLGFPGGLKAKQLRVLGKKQAQETGALFVSDTINTIEKVPNSQFLIQGENDEYMGRTVIVASGVTDLFPHFDKWQNYVGKSMFWCIVCDGYRTRGKKIVVIGENNEAVCTSLQFLNFTKDIVFITNMEKGHEEISQIWLKRLKEANITYLPQLITTIKGENGFVESVILDDGIEIKTDFIFSEQGSIPNYEFVKDLGVELNEKFFIKVDNHQKTNIDRVYAAGDVTAPYSHQLITAAFEGATAAVTANYDLYESYQKH